MPKRIRAKRIVVEVTDEMFADIKKTTKELNINLRTYVLRLITPDLINRKQLRQEQQK